MKNRGRKPFPKDLGDKVRWYYQNTTMSMNEIAKKYDISSSTVSNIIRKKGKMDKNIRGTLCNYGDGSEFRNCGNCKRSTLFKMLSKELGEDVYICELFSPVFAIYVSVKRVCDSWRNQEEIEDEKV